MESRRVVSIMEKNRLLTVYRRMCLARAFDECVDELFREGKLHGTTHLSLGQEASSVVPAYCLDKGDLATFTHRNHAQIIGMGGDVNRMMAELYGKVTGYCKGKGGSMHFTDLEHGNIGANGVVGGGFGIATGAALTQKIQKTGNIVLCFFGDGAVNEGSFHESVNIASIWDLPVIFYCENNQYGMSTHVDEVTGGSGIAQKALAYGIKGIQLDGYCALSLAEQMEKIIEEVRLTNRPVLIEALSYRWAGHSKSDKNYYRTEEEIDSWRRKCPIRRFRRDLLQDERFEVDELERIEAQVEQQVREAVHFAENSPKPERSSLNEDIYA